MRIVSNLDYIKHQIEIVDGDSLRSVLQRVKEEFGTHRKSADALGIGQTVFTRLLNGTVHKRMRYDTYQRIREALRRQPIEFDLDGRFEASVLTFEGSLVRHQYESWMDGEFQRLKPIVGSVLLALYNHPQCQSVFRRFLLDQTRRRELPPPEDRRLWIALYRAVEPLVDAEATWGVERTMEEMDKAGDLYRFLHAGLERERIMLNREHDSQRLNKCTPTDEFLESLAGVDEEDGSRQMPPAEFFAGLDGVEDAEAEKDRK